MKIILREDVADLGRGGDTVDVKTGYARNYLLPRNLAIPATAGNLASVDHLKKQMELRDRKRRRGAEQIRDILERMELTEELLADEEGKVFGSVTNHRIADMIAEKGQVIDKRTILLDEPIKSLGLFTVKVKLAKDVEANIKLKVVQKEKE
jgi:large subunit ribosomal protein L9